ncbi:A/G-specific adenine glycosylase [Saccharomonospora xinjiangensis]|uniref:Adenine DNA glycosylase n=1 Tax=Saccharomonospora xinjiangensis XJ-54 TaxID=882086 RepID=I0V3S3_9PSEU|nr:A/G-specific adenine glycosylase [Saccharomonospora xinjiangensis]EID54776.1 A/G-specific DNA glycosylase [Saccharomonospora xinjiangensis XJ-54]
MSIDVETLVGWFDVNARDLPWRHADRTPWGVLVSEIMLQQTPVARVLPVWQAWLDRWPKPSALASETPGEVVRAWGKLGYPRRALRLHAAATAIACEHGDEVPCDVDTLLGLPGIGAYTARAVAAFAFGRRVPVVDTNVRRVVARAVHGAGDAGPPSTKRDLDDASALLPDGPDEARAARFSAALMELGALVCTARTPRCADCPIAATCAWQKAGRPAYTGPAKPVQRYGGTDRHVRGLLLDVLRGTTGPVEKARLDLAWPKAGQRDACLASLLADGLVEQTADGRFALPGEH